ncbi:MAG: hypothetical protein K0Q53_1497 [Massilibacillus sp.]|nr:hypothetical protein [Massilibacillus sp.]
MDVLEVVMKELRSAHDDSDLRNLDKVSEAYYSAKSENDEIEKKFVKALSEEELKMISKLYDNFVTKEVVTGELYYNQGFADGIRFIIHSLIWKPVRR